MQISNLPDSLLVEIFKRLPCQSVLRCKSVCRSWLSLISDSLFIRSFIQHHQRLKQPLLFTLVHQFFYWHHHNTQTAYRKIQAVSEHPILQSKSILNFLPRVGNPRDPRSIRIVASHGDLVVCYNNKLFSHQTVYYVCNLLTKQWQALPPIPGRHEEDNMAIGLVTYGEDLLVCKYKVVRIFKLVTQIDHFTAEIYCSDTGDWSESTQTCPQSIRRFWEFITSAITLNGALHWIISGNYSGETILVFDPLSRTNGQCRLIDPPLELSDELGHVCFGTSREKLRLSTIKGVHPNRILRVWELQDYDRGIWLVQYRICLKEMVLSTHCQFNMLEISSSLVLSFHPNDEDVVYLRCHNYIMKCNIRNGTLEVVRKCLRDPSLVIRTLTTFPLLHPCWLSSPRRSIAR